MPPSHQPQQSVLKPQAGQRQTACMRNISAPHRSHSILSISGVDRQEDEMGAGTNEAAGRAPPGGTGG